MNNLRVNLRVFLNTHVENNNGPLWANVLAKIGDIGLIFVRILWNGKTITFIPRENHVIETEDALSLNVDLPHVCHNISGTIKTTLAIILLVPGLLLVPFKALSYLSMEMRQQHHLVKLHFTPMDRKIILVRNRAIVDELTAGFNRDIPNRNRPTNTLTVHANSIRGDILEEDIHLEPVTLSLDMLQYIRAQNPKKVVLIGCRIDDTIPVQILNELGFEKRRASDFAAPQELAFPIASFEFPEAITVGSSDNPCKSNTPILIAIKYRVPTLIVYGNGDEKFPAIILERLHRMGCRKLILSGFNLHEDVNTHQDDISKASDVSFPYVKGEASSVEDAILRPILEDNSTVYFNIPRPQVVEE